MQHLHLSFRPPTLAELRGGIHTMATQVEKWVDLRVTEEEEGEEEDLSLSDFPLGEEEEEDPEPEGRRRSAVPAEEAPRSEDGEDFEFQSLCSGGRGLSLEEIDMCAADEVFFQGQILPLRPSVSSRSESMDRHYQSTSSSSSSTAASVSRSSSSTTMSRSHSSSSSSVSSSSTSCCEPPRPSVSSNFYSHPSPKPPHLSSRANVTPRRKSTSSPQGWAVLRLGLVRAPNIELQDLRQRKGSMSSRRHFDAVAAAAATGENNKSSSKRRGLRSTFGCKCSLDDAVEPTSASSSPTSRASTETRRKIGDDGTRLGSSRRRSSSRTFQWLEELLDAGKAPLA